MNKAGLSKALFLAFIPVFFLTSCFGFFSSQGDETDENGLLKANLVVKGVPAQPVAPWSSFEVTVESDSPSVVGYSVDNKDIASISLTSRRCYKVTVGSPAEDTEVTLHFTQEESRGYGAADVSVPFTVKKREVEPLPLDPTAELEGVKISYTESSTPLVNPERGFYGGAVDIFSASSPVKASAAKALRTQGITLMYVGFYLNSFIGGDISSAYLDMIQSSMDALREAGIKCVLRFAYQNSEDSRPWDAPVDVVLRHVEQLKPILQKNADVIFVLQAGFVGVWGEWYYTTNFIMNPSKDSDFEPRRRLMTALLDALPRSRQIALRTPEFKMRMYNLSLKDTLTAKTAHSGEDLSRICGHNDCFGASDTDSGTFDNVSNDREFWKKDTRYTMMGGETCQVSDFCTCNVSLQDMADYHWTYLNSGYNTSVLSRWKKSGCYDEINDRLGYRLIMKDVHYTENPTAGKPIHLYLRFCNHGFAAPVNPRIAEIVFVASDGAKTVVPLLSDPRTWYPGWHVVETEFNLPADKGTFYLALEDPLLPGRAEYSIALANENVFDSKTGWNKLFELK